MVIVVSLFPILNSLIALTIIGLSFGCTVAAIMLSLGKYSTHINPAITVAHAFAGVIRRGLVIPYISFQILGGSIAGLTLRVLFQNVDFGSNLGSTKLATGISPVVGIILEAIGTLSLSVIVLITAEYIHPKQQAFFVGLSLFALILLIGPLTGASFNPARSLGPSLASGFLADQFVFWIGPLVGGIAGAFLFKISQSYGRGNDGRKEHTVCLC